MLDLYVFDLNFNLLGEISEYKEIQIERHYTKVSTLTLRIANSDGLVDLLKHDNIITTQSNIGQGYIIENFFYNDAKETEIEVHAYSLNYILSWRSIVSQQYYNGNVEDVIKAFINSNCINPSNPKRVIPNLRLATNTGINITAESSAFGARLDENVFAICNEHNITVDILMNHTDKKFDVVTWRGADRSTLQNVNPHVIFSKEFDNVIQQQYVNSKADYKTTAYVIGEDFYEEGRLTVTINDEESGFNRRELLIDSSLTSDFTDDEGYRNLLSEEDYLKVLEDEGKQTLATYQIIETFESEVDMYSQFQYGIDYQLGDIVSVRNDEINKINHVRVINATIISNRTGTQLNINFGAPIPTIADKMKKEIKSSNGVSASSSGSSGGNGGTDGQDGVGLNYSWNGTQLGVKREDETSYNYVDLRGPQGSDANVTSANIISALGYTPTKASDITWANVLNKPTTFAPSSHTHTFDDVTGLQAELDAKETPENAQAKVDVHANLKDNPHAVTTRQVNHITTKTVADTPTTYPVGLSIFGLSGTDTKNWLTDVDSSLTGTTYALVETSVGTSSTDRRIVQRITFVGSTATVTHGTYEREGYSTTWQPWKKVLNAGDAATQVEAEDGASTVKYMTPLRTKQAIDKAVMGVTSKPYYIGTTAPTNTNLIWITQ